MVNLANRFQSLEVVKGLRLRYIFLLDFFVQARTRKRKNAEQHKHCGENKVRRKEVHAQKLNDLGKLH